jgi:transposase-like protein
VPRARLETAAGGTIEWKNATIPAYKRHTKQAEALIAGTYLAGTNTRRVRRALTAVFGGTVSKDTVMRAWRKVKSDWDTWTRLLANRLSASSSTARSCVFGLTRKRRRFRYLLPWAYVKTGKRFCWRSKTWAGKARPLGGALFDDLVARGLPTPAPVIVDGSSGLEKALTALWSDLPVQPCTVHKHRNLIAHAPDRLHEEVSADYADLIYAETKQQVAERRKAFLRKWRLKCRAVADSLEEAGDRLFTFTRFPKEQWKSIRTTNAIERLHEEFKRRIKT